MTDKKKMQLGMNPSTASGRLVKDVLWKLIQQTGQSNCCKCGEPMSRDTFSIEHVTPWLDSDDPVGLYFNLDNVAFSHLSCNISDARKLRAICGTDSKYNTGCRCESCKKAKSNRVKSNGTHTSEKRRERYIKYGK